MCSAVGIYLMRCVIDVMINRFCALGFLQYQLVSGGTPGSPQMLQITQGQGGQRVALPLKMLLQPQVS